MSHHPLLAYPRFRQLADTLAARPGALAATDGNPARAAVALALRPGVAGADAVDLLMIRRAEREGDPWSGQIALPGGRWSPNDATLAETAIRETREETGLDLTLSGQLLGALDELRPRTPTLPPIIVTPYVAVSRADVALALSPEVRDAFWVSLDALADPANARESAVSVRGTTWRVPSIVLGEHVVWGMTERILRQFLALME